MATTSAMGISVRHAISRALATANVAPAEATYKVLSARARLTASGRVARGEVTLAIRKPRPLSTWEPHELEGWVNPDGQHPEMVLARLADPIFVDILPATWHSWLLLHPRDQLPDALDPTCPRTGMSLDEARAHALARGCRLPRPEEFRALWGPHRFPWGEEPDPALGHLGRPRFDHIPEAGLHPPTRGLHDLGAWLWHWQDDGTLSGGATGGVPGFDRPPGPELYPVGMRCVCDP